ncbi:MAG: hypothetical protein ACI9MC_003615, partial [Kiritimatiellia bacterium]
KGESLTSWKHRTDGRLDAHDTAVLLSKRKGDEIVIKLGTLIAGANTNSERTKHFVEQMKIPLKLSPNATAAEVFNALRKSAETMSNDKLHGTVETAKTKIDLMELNSNHDTIHHDLQQYAPHVNGTMLKEHVRQALLGGPASQAASELRSVFGTQDLKLLAKFADEKAALEVKSRAGDTAIALQTSDLPGALKAMDDGSAATLKRLVNQPGVSPLIKAGLQQQLKMHEAAQKDVVTKLNDTLGGADKTQALLGKQFGGPTVRKDQGTTATLIQRVMKNGSTQPHDTLVSLAHSAKKLGGSALITHLKSLSHDKMTDMIRRQRPIQTLRPLGRPHSSTAIRRFSSALASRASRDRRAAHGRQEFGRQPAGSRERRAVACALEDHQERSDLLYREHIGQGATTHRDRLEPNRHTQTAPEDGHRCLIRPSWPRGKLHSRRGHECFGDAIAGSLDRAPKISRSSSEAGRQRQHDGGGRHDRRDQEPDLHRRQSGGTNRRRPGQERSNHGCQRRQGRR